MSFQKPVKILDNMDTDIIQKQGWRLNKIFNDDVANSHDTYKKAVDYAKILSAQFNVAIRSMTHKDAHFLEVYRK